MSHYSSLAKLITFLLLYVVAENSLFARNHSIFKSDRTTARTDAQRENLLESKSLSKSLHSTRLLSMESSRTHLNVESIFDCDKIARYMESSDEQGIGNEFQLSEMNILLCVAQNSEEEERKGVKNSKATIEEDSELKPRIHNEKEPKLTTAIQLTEREIAQYGRLNFEAEILPRLKATCFDCHNSTNSSGELNLEQLLNEQPFVINRLDWLNIIEQIRIGSMPPTEDAQPSEIDRRIMLGWLLNAIENFDYSTVRKSGHLPAKRLTHDEYNNTVRDLIGFDLRPADRFPADLTASSGFENSANSLFIQPSLLERYVGAAELIVESAFPIEASSSDHQKAYDQLFGNQADLTSEVVVEATLARFAQRAYRRPVDKEELKSLMSYYRKQLDQNKSREVAIREVLKLILISPNFLMRSESAPTDDSKAIRVSDWELASRLSYYLWASMPDDELFDLASKNRLHDPEVLDAQVERMLADPKSQTLGSLFAAQWLGFSELDRIQRDQIDNPWATDSLVEAMKSESTLFFHRLVQRNESIDRLLDAEFTFLNEELARHYEIGGVEGNAMREVSLKDNPRRGILGHGSILATTSLPNRTSPVIRGNWILSTLFGTPPPPPPPNVSEFAEEVTKKQNLTQRERFELHRKSPNCYSCHSQMDVLGFALEEFEWFGRYRPKRSGKPVDAVGQLPDGTSFTGLAGLSETLIERRGSDLAEQLTRKMLAYALGRQLEYYDEATVIELTKRVEADERKFKTLIREICRSSTFQEKQR